MAASTNGGIPSTTPANSGTKRKRMPESKFYAVRLGHRPGIYHSWPDCLDQVRGFKGAAFKSFPSLTDAEGFMMGDSVAKESGNGVQKYYGVQNGRVTGVYTDWPSAQAQISGWTKPRYKAFTTRVEAEAFVAEGTRNTTPAETNGSTKPPSKRQKKKQEESVPSVDGDVEYDPGEGPLPPGTEDGFDSHITLNHITGKLEYKSVEHQDATKWQATGSSDETGVLRIYTDGSSLGNGKNSATAGVGVYFGPRDSRNLSEPLTGARQTNQRAELTAIQRALEISPRDRVVCIYTDSNYAIKCVTEWYLKWRDNNWLTASRKPVENRDLVEKIIALIDEREKIAGFDERDRTVHSTVKFQWVKGHKDDAGNIAADRLAVQGANEARELLYNS